MLFIICKKHYMEVNCKKLIPKQGNPQECSLSSSDIVEFGLHESTADTDSFKYAPPSFYWLPKLNTNPNGNGSF